MPPRPPICVSAAVLWKVMHRFRGRRTTLDSAADFVARLALCRVALSFRGSRKLSGARLTEALIFLAGAARSLQGRGFNCKAALSAGRKGDRWRGAHTHKQIEQTDS